MGLIAAQLFFEYMYNEIISECPSYNKKFIETLLPKASPLDLCFVFFPGQAFQYSLVLLFKFYVFKTLKVLGQNTSVKTQYWIRSGPLMEYMVQFQSIN